MAKKKDAGITGKFKSWFQEQKDLISEFKKQVADLKKEREDEALGKGVAKALKEQPKERRSKVDITTMSVVKAGISLAVIASLLYLLFVLKDVAVLVLVSFFVAAMLNPFVDMLEKRKVPRSLGVLISYVLILFIVIASIVMLVPVLKTQVDKIIGSIAGYLQFVAENGFTTLNIPFLPSDIDKSLVDWLNELRENINLNLVFEQLREWLIENREAIGTNLGTLSNNFFGVVNNLASGLGNLVIILLLSFFIMVEKEELKEFSMAILPLRHRLYFDNKLGNIQKKIGSWVRGQIILGFAVGIATYIGFLILWLFGIYVEEMVVLSVIAGITEVIPVVGPLLAGMIAALVAANLGFVPMLAVIIMFIIIQQLENNILVPVIMRHAVGLSSFVIIVGMLIGVQFFGFLGLILAVPITTIIGLFVTDYIETRKIKDSKAKK